MNQRLFVRCVSSRHNPRHCRNALYGRRHRFAPPRRTGAAQPGGPSTTIPGQYSRRADVAYEDGRSGRRLSLVYPKRDAEAWMDLCTDSKVADNAEDGDSLMKWQKGHCEGTVTGRHDSAKERMEFVA